MKCANVAAALFDMLYPFLCLQAMQNNGGGSIVLTSAAVAEMGVPHFEAMGAAKAGVEGTILCNLNEHFYSSFISLLLHSLLSIEAALSASRSCW